jgi:antitoxin component of MazEF toxin-antitoxin module
MDRISGRIGRVGFTSVVGTVVEAVLDSEDAVLWAREPSDAYSSGVYRAPLSRLRCAAAILVYTDRMKVVKVRRVGNSNVISIPREFEANGYAPGSSVLVEALPGGDLRIMSTEKVRERIRDIGGRLVAEHGEALEILANHDPDAPQQ